MFLTTGLFYLLTNLPICIYFRIINVKFTNPNNVIGKIIGSIGTLNYSMNFYLYIISGPAFRDELFAMFKCCKTSGDINSPEEAIQENNPDCNAQRKTVDMNKFLNDGKTIPD